MTSVSTDVSSTDILCIYIQASANELGGDEEERECEEKREEKGGLNPDTFSLVEAAQYGNLERWALIRNGSGVYI